MPDQISMIRYDRKDRVTGEIVRFYQHPTGFRIDFVPKRAYSNKFAGLVVPFGADQLSYTDRTSGEPVDVLAGTPFFLKEALLHMDGQKETLGRLADMGIQIEGRVHRTYTTYSFSTVDDFEEGVLGLLSLILEGVLTTDSVELERDRLRTDLLLEEEVLTEVGQEVLLRGMYENRAIYLPEEGPLENIMQIDRTSLENYYRNAYHPRAMTLVIVGSFDGEKEQALIDRIKTFLDALYRDYFNGQSKTNRTGPMFKFPSDYGKAPVLAKQRLELPSKVSAFYLGYKKPYPEGAKSYGGRELVYARLAGALVTEMLIGEGSNCFEEFYEQGLIDESLSIHYYVEQGYSHLVIRGDSKQEERAAELLADRLEEYIRLGAYEEKRMQEISRAKMGVFLRQMDDVKTLGAMVANLRSYRLEFSDYASLFNQITGRDLVEELSFVKEENRVLVLVHGHDKR
jgi:predicted Zn-dependent peptidase